MARERHDQPVLWDQAVLASTLRLSSKTVNVAPVSKLSLTLPGKTDLYSIQPSQPRELAKIAKPLQIAVRKASVDGIKWPLVVLGKPGTGKTCAGLAICDHVRGSEWWPWEEFWRFTGDVNMGRAKGIFLRGQDTGMGWRDPAQRVDWTPKKFWKWFGSLSLAVLDDVGLRGSANDMQYEAFKLALDQRAHKPLIVTSNLTIEQLGGVFDARIMDRLGAGTVVELNGASMR